MLVGIVVLRKKVRRLIVFIDVVHVRHYIKVPVMEIFYYLFQEYVVFVVLRLVVANKKLLYI